jgi:hypothetical protein
MSADLPTLESARDEIQDLFWAAWKAKTPALNNGEVVKVFWPKQVSEAPDVSKPFARVQVVHQTGAQATLGTKNNRRFDRAGFVVIEIFTPVSTEWGLSFDMNLAIIARDAFEGVGTDSGIWFRNVRVQEIGADGNGCWQTNVTADFTYDEVR